MATERNTKIVRISPDAKEAVDALRKVEHRDFIRQMDVVIDAGLKALGQPGLFPAQQ